MKAAEPLGSGVCCIHPGRLPSYSPTILPWLKSSGEECSSHSHYGIISGSITAGAKHRAAPPISRHCPLNQLSHPRLSPPIFPLLSPRSAVLTWSNDRPKTLRSPTQVNLQRSAQSYNSSWDRKWDSVVTGSLTLRECFSSAAANPWIAEFVLQGEKLFCYSKVRCLEIHFWSWSVSTRLSMLRTKKLSIKPPIYSLYMHMHLNQSSVQLLKNNKLIN